MLPNVTKCCPSVTESHRNVIKHNQTLPSVTGRYWMILYDTEWYQALSDNTKMLKYRRTSSPLHQLRLPLAMVREGGVWRQALLITPRPGSLQWHRGLTVSLDKGRSRISMVWVPLLGFDPYCEVEWLPLQDEFTPSINAKKSFLQ